MDKEQTVARIKELKVIQPYLSNYKGRFYVRQISKMLDMSHSTASLALKSLEGKNILSYEIEGKNKKYFLNLENPLTKDYLINSEYMKEGEFIDKHFLFKKMFAEILMPSLKIIKEKPIILFGSYAKGEFGERSDVDIAILGKEDTQLSEMLKEFFERHNLVIHLHFISLNNFLKGVKEKDTLITEIVKNHIVLNNVPVFVGILWRFYYEIG